MYVIIEVVVKKSPHPNPLLKEREKKKSVIAPHHSLIKKVSCNLKQHGESDGYDTITATEV